MIFLVLGALDTKTARCFRKVSAVAFGPGPFLVSHGFRQQVWSQTIFYCISVKRISEYQNDQNVRTLKTGKAKTAQKDTY